MSELNVTSTFVKKLTKNIRLKYGKEPSHTEVMELVADALGWKAGPLMHALKNSVSPQRAYVQELIPYRIGPLNPVADMVREARPLQKLRVLGPEIIEPLMSFVRERVGLLLIIADRNDRGVQYAASLAKAWEGEIGPLEIEPYSTGRTTIPLLESLGVPNRRLAHVAKSPAQATMYPVGHFIMLDAVGSPLNMIEGVEAARILPTILVVNRKMAHLLLGVGEMADGYWADRAVTSERTMLLSALSKQTKIVFDLNDVAGRFHRIKLSAWSEWVDSQSK